MSAVMDSSLSRSSPNASMIRPAWCVRRLQEIRREKLGGREGGKEGVGERERERERVGERERERVGEGRGREGEREQTSERELEVRETIQVTHTLDDSQENYDDKEEKCDIEHKSQQLIWVPRG